MGNVNNADLIPLLDRLFHHQSSSLDIDVSSKGIFEVFTAIKLNARV